MGGLYSPGGIRYEADSAKQLDSNLVIAIKRVVMDHKVAMAARHAARLTTLNSDQIHRADVNGDGIVTAVDAALIARFAAGLVSAF